MLEDVPDRPPLWIVLFNPGAHVSTGAAFGALEPKVREGMPPPDWDVDFLGWLHGTRNDFTPGVAAQFPAVKAALRAMEHLAEPAGFVGMSGSGSTCFALFTDEARAHSAAAELSERASGWVQVAEVMR